MKLSFASRVNLGFALAFFLLLIVGFFSYRNAQIYKASSQWVVHTVDVLRLMETVGADEKSLVAAERGYLLTGNDRFQIGFQNAVRSLYDNLDTLRTLIGDNKEQITRLNLVNSLLRDEIDLYRKLMSIRREKSTAAAVAASRKDEAWASVEELRSTLAQMKLTEKQLLEQRDKETVLSAAQTTQITLLGGVLAFAIALWAFFFINKTERRRSENDHKIEVTNQQKTWLNTLNERMQGDQTTSALCKSILTYLSESIGIKVGAIYLEADSKLRFEGGFAYEATNAAAYFALGEGVVGQVGRDLKAVTLAPLPDHYLTIRSALGSAVPTALHVAPLTLEEKLFGVIEVGTLSPFKEHEIDFLRTALSTISLGLVSARNRHLTAELLNTTQAQSEELLSQQEELRQTNEELEEQSRALKASEEALRKQSNALIKTNEELAAHTRLLTQKNSEIENQNLALERARTSLQGAVTAATDANRAKSTFLATMSHELRTPLNSILLLSEILGQNRDNNLTSKQVEFATTIHQSGADLLTLINDILDLSKVEAGKIDLTFEEIPLSDIAQTFQGNFEQLAQSKNLTYSVETASDVPHMIRSDQQRVVQILRNLLSNAFKFTERGSVKLSISKPTPQMEISEPGLRESGIAFSVTDTGCGIAASKQQLVFQTFQQVDGSVGRKYGGSGLGLSISREFAKLLGGEVFFTSVEGQGSTFTLVLPEQPPVKQMAAAPPEPAPESPLVSLDMAEIQHRGGQPLLIIEDDPRFARTLSDYAERYGFAPYIAATGLEGIELALQKEPVAILLDLRLPDVDGLEVLHMIHASPKTSNTPVQVITASDREAEAMRAGAVGFLAKPVTSHKLESILQALGGHALTNVKNLLVLEEPQGSVELVNEIAKMQIQTKTAATGAQALTMLASGGFHGLVIGSQISDMAAIDFLSQARALPACQSLPIILYSQRVLTSEEANTLGRYTQSIIVRGSHSMERLLEEVKLFLNSLNESVPLPHRPKSSNPSLKDLRVLLVDDDTRNVYALLSVLESEGMQVTVAKNGKESLEKLAADSKIEFVLMDIMMPEMDGYEAMRQIRKQDKHAHLPIIALTAKAMKEDRARCLDAGANEYLSKPVDIEKLLALMTGLARKDAANQSKTKVG